MKFSSKLAEPSIKQMRIDHAQGQFQVMHEGEWSPLAADTTKNVIVLAGINQRQHWSDGAQSYVCASHDNVIGIPRPNFPWAETGFIQSGSIECAACPFSKWTPDATGRNIPPVCGEKILLLALIPVGDNGELELHGLPLSYSARRPLQAYVSTYSDEKLPLFAFATRMTVNINLGKKGRRYAVPTFTRGPEVPSSLFPFLMELSVKGRALALDPPPPPPRKSGGFFGGGGESAGTHTGSFFS